MTNSSGGFDSKLITTTISLFPFLARQQQGNMRNCAGCREKIFDRFLLYALDQYWHINCLKCSCCDARLGEIGTSCYSKGGMILCKTDYVRYVGKSFPV